jgi:hypothetical protein
MSVVRFSRATALLAAAALAGGATAAHACTDGSKMKYYFFREWPEDTQDVIQVRILSMDGQRVVARLSEPFAHALGREIVTIELPIYPEGSNCVGAGVTEGLVFAPVSGLVEEGGKARFFGMPVMRRLPERRRKLSEIDSYIVDPAMRKAAAEDRRKYD